MEEPIEKQEVVPVQNVEEQVPIEEPVEEKRVQLSQEMVSTEKKKAVDEKKLLRTIVSGSDWQTVIAEIIEQEQLDPWAIDVIKLTDAFVKYLGSLKSFDFRIPARFVLIAAILLRMKVELLMEKEEKEIQKEEEKLMIDLDKVPPLGPPGMRKPIRKVTLTELIGALNKAFEFQERKETSIIHRHRMVETLIEEDEDIEDQIIRIMSTIVSKSKSNEKQVMFSSLVPDWTRAKAVSVFLPLLHLANRQAIRMEQEKIYSDFVIITLDAKKADVEAE
ncbi:hypothetical protein CL614_04880 [archaeon]|nr:hypothetical protein [archaeon]|tara:strand:+ start:1934 stop:2764 length:831 start_codon:yes stop_codon:yes gene_type:complete